MSVATQLMAPRPARLTRKFHLAAAGCVLLLGAAQYALTMYAGRFGLLAAIGLGQAVLALAWSQGTRTHGFPGSILVIGGCALACDVMLWNGGRPRFADLALPVAGALLAGFVHQIQRRHPRPRLAASLAQDVTGAVSVAALSTMLIVDHLIDDRETVALIIAAVTATAAVGHLLDTVGAVPRVSYDVARGAIGMLLGVAAGAGLLVWRLNLGALSDLLLYVMVGGAIGLAAIIGSVAMSFITADRRPSRWSALALHAGFPLCFVAPVAYVVLLFVLSV